MRNKSTYISCKQLQVKIFETFCAFLFLTLLYHGQSWRSIISTWS
jgi:hypothetical protein